MIKSLTTDSRADAQAPALNPQPSTPNCGPAPAPAVLAEPDPGPQLPPGICDSPVAHVPSPLVLVTPPLSSEQAATLIDAQPLPLPAHPRKLRRRGLVASLPAVQRDMVNRMLDNGVPYKNITGALSEAGYTVSEKNISNWAIGGFPEWRLVHEHVVENRLDQDQLLDFLRRDDAPELPEVGLQAAATRLSQVMLQKLNSGEDPEAHLASFSKLVDLLCRLNREIGATQKQRDNSRRVLGPEYEPARVKEQEQIDAMEFEQFYTNPPADSGLPQPAVPVPLPPYPTAAFNAQQAREERVMAETQRQRRTLEIIKSLRTKVCSDSKQPEHAPIPSANSTKTPPPAPNAAGKATCTKQ